VAKYFSGGDYYVVTPGTYELIFSVEGNNKEMSFTRQLHDFVFEEGKHHKVTYVIEGILPIINGYEFSNICF